MGETEDPETAQQLTSAAGLPTQAAPEVELAWSGEDAGTPLLRRPWRSAWTRAGLVALCGIVVAVAVCVIGWHLFGRRVAAPPRPAPSVAAPAPAPATNNPTAAPPAIPPAAAPTTQAAPPAADHG